MQDEALYLGLDLGTSGCRLYAIDGGGRVRVDYRRDWPPGEDRTPAAWWSTTCDLLTRCAAALPAGRCRSLAVDGTSGTLMLCDAEGRPVGPVLMYHDDRARAETRRIGQVAPPASPVHSTTSSLAKLLWLQALPEAARAHHALHQADWITGRLLGRFGVSDENNCLKLGYDAQRRCWPPWLTKLGVAQRLLPEVVPAGTPLGRLDGDLAARLGLPQDLQIVAGTTDGVAGFLASGARQCGEAVTSLGSTLILKILSDEMIAAPQYGVYSHRLPPCWNPRGPALWLAGGASNCGGAVLRRYFTREELERMTPRLRPDRPTGLDYYPLPGKGERFPTNDPELTPRLSPRPRDPVRFFQAILEGIARVEERGYRLLAELGAPWPRRVYTVGGGAVNEPWRRIRARRLEVPVLTAVHQEAAYGAALLAREGLKTSGQPTP